MFAENIFSIIHSSANRKPQELTLKRGVLGGDDINSCSSVKTGRCLLAENTLLLKEN